MARTSLLQACVRSSDRKSTKRQPTSNGNIAEDSTDDQQAITVTCTKCGHPKDASEFSPSSRHRNGLFPWCKRCKASYQAHYINAVPKEERLAKAAAFRSWGSRNRITHNHNIKHKKASKIWNSK